jgi:SnoaL-like domain
MSDERDVQQVLARYVRATDCRNSAAMSALFARDGWVEICYHQAGILMPIAVARGAQAIGQAADDVMRAPPTRGWTHHTTHDPIIEVMSDSATIDVQFIVFESRSDLIPATGWSHGASGTQGTVRPVDAGYYRAVLRRFDGVWKIASLRIIHDLPVALPARSIA